MWLYYSFISTIIYGILAIVIKKYSNNELKRMVIMGLLSINFIMIIVSLIIYPNFITSINIIDMIKMLPGALIHIADFYCAIAAIKYGKVAVTASIKKAKVVVVFLLGIIILKEDCTILQLVVSIILMILSILVARNKNENDKKVSTQLDKKAIFYSFGYVIFNGISSFLNKIYVTEFQNPLYVSFYYAIIIVIGIMFYCLITKQWNYINIRKMNNKKYFILQSLLNVSASISDRFALLDGNISVISVITTSSIIITILGSRLILKEKITYKKYLMMLGIFICVLILAIIR